jgi:hypothetical protein
MWIEGVGMLNLGDVIHYGAGIDGFGNAGALGVSADGLTIVGSGNQVGGPFILNLGAVVPAMGGWASVMVGLLLSAAAFIVIRRKPTLLP